MFRLPKGTEMTPELLAEYIGKHKKIVNERLQKLQNAYENDYEIYDEIKNPKKDSYKPDNRISINHAKFIVDTFNGFFYGIPLKITVKEGFDDAYTQDKEQTERKITESEKITDFIEFLDRYNNMDNRNREIAKMSDILGASHEIYFTDEDGKIGIMYLSRLESFFIYDESIRQRPMFFVRYYKDYENKERGSWSDAYQVQKFVHDGSYKWVDKPELHYFGDVPATEFPENTERRGLFESELSAINEYNKALSEKANDVDYFADAYLKILGPHVEEKDTKHMRTNRVINFEGDDGNMPVIDFMAKPSADGTQENLLNRLKADIFQTAMVPDINDENFGSVSGVALKYRLLSMSNLAKGKAGLFKEALARRYRIIFANPVVREFGIDPDDWMRLEYKFTENYPANVSDEVDTARNLEGIVSKDTQLKVLSIVEDVQGEKEKMETERQEAEGETIMDRLMFGKEEETADGQSDVLEGTGRETKTTEYSRRRRVQPTDKRDIPKDVQGNTK